MERSGIYLRVVLVMHMVWIAMIGAIVRGVVRVPDIFQGVPSRWFDVAFLLPFILFPVAAFLAAGMRKSPTWKNYALVFVEIALFVTYCVALFPAVQ